MWNIWIWNFIDNFGGGVFEVNLDGKKGKLYFLFINLFFRIGSDSTALDGKEDDNKTDSLDETGSSELCIINF